MKVYIASRTRHRAEVRQLLSLLKEHGHDAICDWTNFDQKMKEEDFVDQAEEIVSKIPSSDVFILISDAAGTDMFTELGIALATNERSGKPKIYVVGEHGKRSLLLHHPKLLHKKKVIDVLMEICPKIPEKKVKTLAFS